MLFLPAKELLKPFHEDSYHGQLGVRTGGTAGQDAVVLYECAWGRFAPLSANRGDGHRLGDSIRLGADGHSHPLWQHCQLFPCAELGATCGCHSRSWPSTFRERQWVRTLVKVDKEEVGAPLNRAGVWQCRRVGKSSRRLLAWR